VVHVQRAQWWPHLQVKTQLTFKPMCVIGGCKVCVPKPGRRFNELNEDLHKISFVMRIEASTYVCVIEYDTEKESQ